MLRLLQRRSSRLGLGLPPARRTYGCIDTSPGRIPLAQQNYHHLMPSRYAHSNGIYVHHTTGLSGQNSIAATIALFYYLKSSREHSGKSIGFFTPIDVCSSPLHGPSRFQIIKDVFAIRDPVESMCGIPHARALELIEYDRADDIIEEVLKAYEAYKANHDFVVVEGISLKRPGDDTTLLNAKIASTFGLPVLMVTNARKAAGVGERRIVRWDKLEWEREIAFNVQISASIMKRQFVDILGSVVYRLPSTKRGDRQLYKHFKELKIPLLGAVPEHPVLKRIKVEDIISALGADILFGTHDAIANSKESSHFVAAMQQLSDALAHIKSLKETEESIVVVTDPARPDILLGLIDAHQSSLYPNVSAIILAGGGQIQPDIELLIKEQQTENLPPIIRSPDSSFETAATLADLEARILPESVEKIECAKVLFNRHVDVEHINELLEQDREMRIHPKVFQQQIFSQAMKYMQNIVLPEGDEPRTVQAAGILLKQGICKLTMLGDSKKIKELAEEFHVDLSLATLIDPSKSENLEKYAQLLYESRKHKGMTHEEALKLIQDVNYFGTCMVASGDADGMVSGAIHTTADTVRPALQIIKIEPGLKIASSVFFMCFQGKVLVFGDCAINTDPTSEELASIAISSADTATAFGVEPRVALLSYATGDSNSGPIIQKVADAVTIAKKAKPDLLIDGPLQYDAAVNPETAKIKLKGKAGAVAGKASVLIFPDLNTGNTTYKAVQQSTGAIAMGPVIQGLRKPVNDLSRGCTVDDIVSTVAITAVQAGSRKHKQ